MPLSDYDHVQALRNRLTEERRGLEMKVKEIDEMIRTLGNAPKLLQEIKGITSGMSKEAEPTEPKSKGRKLVNRQNTALTREYIQNAPEETPLDVNTIVKFLQSHGVKGEDRGLYSQVHVILKKEASPARGTIRYMKDVGFFKPKKEQAGLVEAHTE